MCWFSLAMSPFAPGGWLDALEFTSRSRSRDEGGMGVTTSHPIALFLALGPALVLGAAGLAGGAIYRLFVFARYLRTASPDTRARHRRQKRDALRGKALRWYVLVIGIALFAAGASLGAWAARNLMQAVASRGWPQTPGRIIESNVKSWEDSEGDQHYSASIRYQYEADRMHVGDRISFGDFAGGASRASSLVHRYPQGKEVQVYIRPESAGAIGAGARTAAGPLPGCRPQRTAPDDRVLHRVHLDRTSHGPRPPRRRGVDHKVRHLPLATRHLSLENARRITPDRRLTL
jgi:hypothetical protein